MSILLSVIVPVYNVKEYLARCIESICSQSYSKLEIILIDDGSTDGSEVICDEYAEIDSRIKVLHKENGGQVSARKAGVNLATGDYAISVDADDWIEKERFKNLVEKGLSYAPDMVYVAGMYKDYEDRTVFIPSYKGMNAIYEGDEIRTELMKYPVGEEIFMERRMEFSHWTWCVKLEIYRRNILKINENIRRIEDFISIFSCILDSRKIVCIDEPSYHYIQREGSINKRKKNWNENHANIYFMQMKEILSRNTELITPEIMNVVIQYLYHNIFLTNYKKLYDYYEEYLFPYIPVKKGSKIVVYGAGNIGVEIINAIDANPNYEVVAWVDKKVKGNVRSNHKVERIETIKDKQYDYIIVAILVADISKAVRNDLINIGISQEKIVLMECKVMQMEDIKKILE